MKAQRSRGLPVRPGPFLPWLLLFAVLLPGLPRGAGAQTLDELYRQAGSAMDQGRFQDAAALYRQAAQLSPGDADPLVGLGFALTRLGQVEEAVAVLDRALALDPNSSDAHTNMGFAHWTLGNRDRAVMEYGIAARLNPDNVQAHYNLGNSHMAMGSAAQAIAPLERVIQLQPNHVDALVTLGAARIFVGDAAGALPSLRQAVSLAPDRSDAHFNLGLALGRAGDMAGAAGEHGWLEASGSELARVLHNQLGDGLFRAKRIREALPQSAPPPQAEADPSVSLLGVSAGEGLAGWDEPGAEDAIVGTWYGEFREASGPTPLGEAHLSITKTDPGTYRVQVTSGWIRTDSDDDAPYFSGCILRFIEKGQDIRGQTVFRYQGESGAFYRDGTPRPVNIGLSPGYARVYVRANIAGASTGSGYLERVEGGG